ncbi:hypothetical protein [Flavobacterium sp. TAB 87]|uniref:hypothetical protein n=1 Tax=Flavobacterium sp. TAB 87 TaxID=1729581 RepID=UPI0018D20491|nr:hypothetical protein [Flavobacterium sp. TAB 87]
MNDSNNREGMLLMKKNIYRYVANLLCLLSTTMTLAQVPPSPPSGPPGGGGPPVLPGLPIDDYIIAVFVFALIFGSYMIYRYNQKQKNPV